jgi:hypothetical protein
MFVKDVEVFRVDVEKVDLDVSMLRDDADVFLDVLGVVFECCRTNLMLSPSIRDPCCRHVMLRVVARGRRGGGHLMLDVANINFQCCGC